MSELQLVLASTTWNTVDLVDLFLTHYQRLGFSHAFVMDYDSSDGSREVLDSARWQPFVRRVPFQGLASLDASNLLLSAIREACGPDAWVLFCDPDELLVSPVMQLDLSTLRGFDSEVAQVTFQRFNMTAPRSVARTAQTRLNARDALTLRIVRRATRSPDRDMLANILEPPWIYTAIPGKVLTRVGATRAIGPGDHEASLNAGRTVPAPEGTYLLHYPLRSYDEFVRKVGHAAEDFRANPHLPAYFGWQLRRWVRLSSDNALYDEYLQQFVPDDDVERLVRDGTLHREERVSRLQTAPGASLSA
ncbi:MAG: glycosyltransferase family 2 protein [Candidatus Limnocylindrales bacterium]